MYLEQAHVMGRNFSCSAFPSEVESFVDGLASLVAAGVFEELERSSLRRVLVQMA